MSATVLPRWMSEPAFPGWSYWEFPLGDGWLILALGAVLLAALFVRVRP